jgi:hypothetical protein
MSTHVDQNHATTNNDNVFPQHESGRENPQKPLGPPTQKDSGRLGNAKCRSKHGLFFRTSKDFWCKNLKYNAAHELWHLTGLSPQDLRLLDTAFSKLSVKLLGPSAGGVETDNHKIAPQTKTRLSGYFCPFIYFPRAKKVVPSIF